MSSASAALDAEEAQLRRELGLRSDEELPSSDDEEEVVVPVSVQKKATRKRPSAASGSAARIGAKTATRESSNAHNPPRRGEFVMHGDVRRRIVGLGDHYLQSNPEPRFAPQVGNKISYQQMPHREWAILACSVDDTTDVVEFVQTSASELAHVPIKDSETMARCTRVSPGKGPVHFGNRSRKDIQEYKQRAIADNNLVPQSTQASDRDHPIPDPHGELTYFSPQAFAKLVRGTTETTELPVPKKQRTSSGKAAAATLPTSLQHAVKEHVNDMGTRCVTKCKKVGGDPKTAFEMAVDTWRHLLHGVDEEAWVENQFDATLKKYKKRPEFTPGVFAQRLILHTLALYSTEGQNAIKDMHDQVTAIAQMEQRVQNSPMEEDED